MRASYVVCHRQGRHLSERSACDSSAMWDFSKCTTHHLSQHSHAASAIARWGDSPRSSGPKRIVARFRDHLSARMLWYPVRNCPDFPTLRMTGGSSARGITILYAWLLFHFRRRSPNFRSQVKSYCQEHCRAGEPCPCFL